MNVQLGRGGKVHYAGEPDGFMPSPVCGGNRACEKYRTVKADVNCANCLKIMAKEAAKAAEVEPAEAAPVEEPAEEPTVNVETTDGKFQVGQIVRYVGEHRPDLAGELVEITRAVDHVEPNIWGGDRFTYVVIVPGIPASAVGVNERELEAHDETTCQELDCDICLPPYVPQVGDRIEDGHTAKLGQIRTVVGIRGHLAEIRIEGPMFHAAHYGQETIEADGTFTRKAIRKVEKKETETMPTHPKPEWTKPAPRARLRLSNVTAQLSHSGEILILAEDSIRGPVEITMGETDSRWLRACIADMGPLSTDD
jgi:hypothetical protein